MSHNTDEGGKGFMRVGTKQAGRGGRPRKFDEREALGKMRRQIWTMGLSGVSLDGIARSAGLNRPSLAAAFGDKNAIYAQAAAQFAATMDERLRQALAIEDLGSSLRAAFDAAVDIYTADGPDGCFVICTAPAEALTNPVCRDILDQTLTAIDAVFLQRLAKEARPTGAKPVDLSALAEQLGATLHSVALRARAGWSRDRLRSLTAGAVDQVLAALRTRLSATAHSFLPELDLPTQKRQSSARACAISSKHAVWIVRALGHRLQHIPVFKNLAVGIEAEDIDARGFLAAPIQIPHMDERQIAVDGDTLDLAGHFLHLFEEVDDEIGAVREHRVVLDVRAGHQTGQQVTSTLVEDFAVDGVDGGFHLVALHEVRSLV